MNNAISKKYLSVIQKFDEDISSHVKQLETEIANIKFDPSKAFEFVLDDTFNSTVFKQQPKQKGLYLFEVDLDSMYPNSKKRDTRIKKFADEWQMKKYNSFFSSSIIKKRLKTYEKYDKQWLPMYLGKNHDVYKRLTEHIELSPQKHTYAMKLRHRTNLNSMKFRVSVIELDVENYDFIVPHLERALREEYCPIIGKQ